MNQLIIIRHVFSMPDKMRKRLEQDVETGRFQSLTDAVLYICRNSLMIRPPLVLIPSETERIQTHIYFPNAYSNKEDVILYPNFSAFVFSAINFEYKIYPTKELKVQNNDDTNC